MCKRLVMSGLMVQLLAATVFSAVPTRRYNFEEGNAGAASFSVADSIALQTIVGTGDGDGFLWLEVAGNTTRPLPAGQLQTVVNNVALVDPALEAFFGQGTFVNVADGSSLDSPALGSTIGLQFDGTGIFDDLITGAGSKGILVDAAAYAANDVVAANVNTFESFSILSQAWVRPSSSASGTAQTIYQVGNEQGGVAITPDGFWQVNNLGTGWYPGVTGELTSTIPVAFDEWTHVAVFRGGTGGTLYINGREASEDLPGDQFFNTFANFVSLGGDQFADATYVGVVDDFVISGLADQVFDRFTDLEFFDSVENLIEVNQQTGNVQLRNTSDQPIVLGQYALTSVNGALDPDAWTSITENYDGDSGASLDSDNWSILSQVGTDLSEAEMPANDGLTLAAGASIDLGNIWFRSPIRDLAIDILAPDGSFVDAKVVFVDGNGSPVDAVLVGDLTFEGDIGVADWSVFVQNFGGDFTGLSVAESYGLGDLDFDGDSDIDDFEIFRIAFDDFNGPGAFAAMVPEPNAGLLIVMASLLAVIVGRRTRA